MRRWCWKHINWALFTAWLVLTFLFVLIRVPNTVAVSQSLLVFAIVLAAVLGAVKRRTAR